jgi:CHASE2 domain-containing sensor protein
MSTTQSSSKPPTWFWIASILGLLWNALGVFAYLGQAYMTDEMKAALPEEQLQLMESTPAWVTAAFAIAVWGGLLGCIFLLVRKRWARPVFMVSLIGILLQIGYSVLMTNAMEVYGLIQALVMPVLVVAIGFLLYFFSGIAIKKLWIS